MRGLLLYFINKIVNIWTYFGGWYFDGIFKIIIFQSAPLFCSWQSSFSKIIVHKHMCFRRDSSFLENSTWCWGNCLCQYALNKNPWVQVWTFLSTLSRTAILSVPFECFLAHYWCLHWMDGKMSLSAFRSP